MTHTILYVDHRGWRPLSGHCRASVIGMRRMKQCSRKAKTLGRIRKYGVVNPVTHSDPVPLCRVHADAANVEVV